MLFVQINTIQEYEESAVYNVPFSSRCTLAYKQLAIFRNNVTESRAQLKSAVCVSDWIPLSFAFPQKQPEFKYFFNFCLNPSTIFFKLLFLLLFCIFYLYTAHGDHTVLVIRTCGLFIIVSRVSSIVSVI